MARLKAPSAVARTGYQVSTRPPGRPIPHEAELIAGEPTGTRRSRTVEDRVGNKNKKYREAYEASVRTALENLRVAQLAARETFDEAFERLERKGASRLE